MRPWFQTLSLLFCFLVLTAASCRPLAEDTSSLSALEAGQATMVLGGCSRPLSMGYEACQIERGAKLPPLHLAFTNPADYAVSDCQLGLFKTGSVSAAGEIDIDVSPLQEQIEKAGFCILKVESIERFPSQEDPNQLRELPVSGGFFVEVLPKGYMPVPAPNVVGWCYQIERTTKGRTIVKECRPK